MIATSTSAGPNKKRRRFTAVPEDVTLSLVLNSSQLDVLRDFATNVVQDVLPFDCFVFVTGYTEMYTFKVGYSSVKQTWYAGDM